MAKFFRAQAKQTTPKILTVEVKRFDQNGRGVSEINGKPLFIKGVLPQEKASVKVIEQKGKFATAQLLQLQRVSTDRVEAKCQHFYACGGCDLQHIAYNRQLQFKQDKVEQLFSREQISHNLPWQDKIISELWHYRRRARIGVQYNKQGSAIIGFRQHETNALVSIKQCFVLTEGFSDIFQQLNELFAKLSGKNAIGHIEVLKVNRHVVVIRQLVKMSAKDKQHWQDFSLTTGFIIFVDDGNEIVPLNEKVDLYYQLFTNDLPLYDSYPIQQDVVLSAVKITLEPQNFMQINEVVNESMIKQALAWLQVSKKDQILDLFCGLGNFSLPLAQLAKSVVGVEGVQKMVDRARHNADINQLTNCQFFQANINSDWRDFDWAKQSYEVVIIDPARAGAYKAIEQLLKLKIAKILYISCDAQTLAKDSKLLIEHQYKIDKISIIDMFAHTKHVETMVLFSLDLTSS